MNKVKREIYLILTEEIFTPLCSACKYAYSYGSGCDCGSMECTHKLNDYAGFPLMKADGDLEPGMDCWGFRPDLKVADLADIAGIILAQNWDEWFWITKKDGKIKVYGRDSRTVKV